PPLRQHVVGHRALRPGRRPPERPPAAGRLGTDGRAGSGFRRRGRPPALVGLAPSARLLEAVLRPRREVARLEGLDRTEGTPAELAGNLADMARLNRIGPIRTLLAFVAPLVQHHRGPEPLTVLDLGTGVGDIPVALTTWARAKGVPLRVVGLDSKPGILACARARVEAFPEIGLVTGEALAPPVRPGAVDLVICSLMLHHLPERV